MDSCSSPIELNKDVPFIENEWISQRKKFADVPAFVRWEKDKVMEIPLDFLQSTKFPEPTLSINEFLALELPRLSSEIISNKVARWFSKDPQKADKQLQAALTLSRKRGENSDG
jgi:hypothetical protein